MKTGNRKRVGFAVGCVLLMLVGTATAGADTGAICIAPFQAPKMASEPPMDPPTWPPTAGSKFTFRIDKKLRATVAQGEMALITEVPADRKVLVEVRLDGRPFEAFRLDLRKEPGKRTCLWLYEGYWHWVNTSWDAKKGCRCEVDTSGR